MASLRRLITLLAGVVFFGVGIYLIMQGIAATGTLDIQSAFVSGKIQSGSAGLFEAFLATIIIIFGAVSGDDAQRAPGAANTPERKPRFGTFYIPPLTCRLAWILATLLLIAAAAALAVPASGPQNTLHGLLIGVMFVVGFAALFLFIWLLISMFDYDNGEDEEDEKSPAA